MKKVISILLVFVMFVPSIYAQKKDMQYFIDVAVKDGILLGDEKGDLGTEKPATRAEFLSLVVRMFGLSGGEANFNDVKSTDWFYDSIAAAKLSGIFAGYDDGTAKPMENVSVQDAVTILGRYSNATEYTGTYLGISDYAREYYAYAYENGFFDNFDYLPTPKRNITKGEIINLLYNYKEAYDRKDCFAEDYPTISNNTNFGMITVDCKLNDDSEIYYLLCNSGKQSNNWTICFDNAKANKCFEIKIPADVSKKYDLYIKAVSKSSGIIQIKSFKNVIPFAYINGEGTQKSPYVIYTEMQLSQIESAPNKYYILENDIELSEDWEPITKFSGNFNGNGYRITGLSIDNDSKSVGLFSEIDKGSVYNLTVDANIKANRTAGAIAGINNGLIEGCSVTGNIEVKTNEAGGICGKNNGTINNSLSAMYLVKAGIFAGGISGQNTGEIKNCLSAADSVFSDMYAGGISGANNAGMIENCVAANMAVYNTMTYNSGKIATNQNGGVTKNNYSYDEMTSNAARREEDSYSQNGFEKDWDTLTSSEFYYHIGWDKTQWRRANSGFILLCPNNAAEPMLEYGKTIYMPKKIATADELRNIANDLSGHYVLSKDIDLKLPWKSIGGADGFSGTFDGAGYSIYNLTLKSEAGFFSNIAGGTVKNLTFYNVNALNGGVGGIISACNFGYIENCKVYGNASTKGSASFGGIVSENNGRILNCAVKINIDNKAENNLLGGICANNIGEIVQCSYFGEINSNATNTVIGGICGMDTDGYLTENYAAPKITSKNGDTYIGGICGISEGTKIYKCASKGNVNIEGDSLYIGGIAGLSTANIVYNCLSGFDANASGKLAYVGGIVGYLKEANLQNTYSYGTLISISTNENSLGGICGQAEDSFIMQNVSLNPTLNGSGNVYSVVGHSESCEVSDNFSLQNTKINFKNAFNSENNGTVKSLTTYKNINFFINPLSNGGALGWDEDAWKRISGYDFPVLTNTPETENLIMPIYK